MVVIAEKYGLYYIGGRNDELVHVNDGFWVYSSTKITLLSFSYKDCSRCSQWISVDFVKDGRLDDDVIVVKTAKVTIAFPRTLVELSYITHNLEERGGNVEREILRLR